MGSGNGRSTTHNKLNRYDLEDFTPRDEQDEGNESALELARTAAAEDDHHRPEHIPAASGTGSAPRGSGPVPVGRDEKPHRRSAAEAYRPLHDFLETFGGDTVMISFAALENILKRKLPASARERETWWTNKPRGQGHAKAWRDIGWRVERVDLARGRVSFTRLS
ncbi:MAG: DUF7662 domain-containing protein [Actinomycetota bacterium]